MNLNLVKPKNSELYKIANYGGMFPSNGIKKQNFDKQELFDYFFFGFESTLLARQVQQEHTQMEA